ncbi:hypothetical protein lpari_00988 [Legionella parisiensis]|uniref:Uncharacterized protein n=1 Tax=Legionella parisiensis TaxID=45071 RepID=A0A1E5JTU0_9GAMM|nr:hypothetical protein lpari_00988 [Legionella parisiensis]
MKLYLCKKVNRTIKAAHDPEFIAKRYQEQIENISSTTKPTRSTFYSAKYLKIKRLVLCNQGYGTNVTMRILRSAIKPL